MRSSSKNWTRSSNNLRGFALAGLCCLLSAACAGKPQENAAGPELAPAHGVAPAPPVLAQTLETPNHSRIHVAADLSSVGIGAAPVLAWVTRAATTVEQYYGRFPLQLVNVELSLSDGGGIRGGRVVTWGGAPRILMNVSRHVRQADLDTDWRMTHEMVHLALPNLAEEHHWLEEGIATYVEPIARARSGWLAEELVWREWLDNMARGLPEAGDRGLDRTPTWGRTYWGGALFCLLADVEIHRQTGSRLELGDALRAILKSGDIRQQWPIKRVLGTGDAALGGSVLSDLYERMRNAPAPVDLAQLWAELGVRSEAGRITYADAPLAAVRRVLVTGRKPAG